MFLPPPFFRLCGCEVALNSTYWNIVCEIHQVQSDLYYIHTQLIPMLVLSNKNKTLITKL